MVVINKVAYGELLAATLPRVIQTDAENERIITEFGQDVLDKLSADALAVKFGIDIAPGNFRRTNGYKARDRPLGVFDASEPSLAVKKSVSCGRPLHR